MCVRFPNECLDRTRHELIVTRELRRKGAELDAESESLDCSNRCAHMRTGLSFDEGFDGEFGTDHAVSVTP